ncbi:peptide/nickel transport system substrate-binding protein [Thermotomaculum hydrothermale]|uniref:Peptide/nickel transport system substrate-binding protein n=1 Tax=Thermotomaculum hydrothermale TaxID=981385 RepID=A0A7R6PP01_9BACT|nr:ABC transporter substrate-binding protein [Thermotomaculum hydrothermale]BBB33173.1 peptide/nickel transport system substrate-binding protein [Thermotomaculum hydrothermale]
MKKIFFLLLIFLFFPISCRYGGKTPPNTLVVLVDGYPQTFDPRMGIDLSSQRIYQLVYNGLFVRDEKGELKPDLVESYYFKHNSVFRFKLRKGIYFHNGDELKVEDVFYTVKSLIEKGSLKSAPFLEIGEMKKIDDYSGELVLKRKDPSFLINLCDGAFGVVSRKDGVSGTGAYIIVKKDKGKNILLKGFDNYFKGKPKTEFVLLKTVKDSTTRTFEILNKSADIVFDSIPYENLKLFKKGDYRIYRGISNSVEYIAFNFKDKILSDRKVRQAICMAIDRDRAIKYLFYGYAVKASSMIAPPNFYHFEGNQCVSSIKQANRILDSAGYKIKKDGYRFSLEFLSTTSFLSRLKAVYVQDRLKKIGIKVDIVSMDFGTFFDLLSKGKFQMYSARWVGISDPDIYRMVFYSKMIPPKGWNRGFYKNEEVDRLVESIPNLEKKEERRKVYKKINSFILSDYAYIFLWHPENLIITLKNVENLIVTPSKSFAYLYLVEKR